jgi:hypothetical protein
MSLTLAILCVILCFVPVLILLWMWNNELPK